jgi:hypothetical protein
VIHVRDDAGHAVLEHPVALGSGAGRTMLPLSFGVAPRGHDPTRVATISVDAMHAGATLFTYRVTSSFVADRALELDIFLESLCTDVAVRTPCDTAGRNCGRGGECTPQSIDPATLPLFDGGVVSDVHSIDAVSGDVADAQPDAITGSDVPMFGDGRICNPTGRFGVPTAFADFNTPSNEMHPTLTADENTIYFARGSAGAISIYVSRRLSATAPWSVAAPVTGIDTSAVQTDPSVSGDGTAIVFMQAASGSPPSVTASTTLDGMHNFTSPMALMNGSTMNFMLRPFMTLDQSEIWMTHETFPGPSSVIEEWSSIHTFGLIMAHPELGTSIGPVLSRDRLTIFFSSATASPTYIARAARLSPMATFSVSSVVQELMSPLPNALPSWLSPDGCRLYVEASTPSNGIDMFVVEQL